MIFFILCDPFHGVIFMGYFEKKREEEREENKTLQCQTCGAWREEKKVTCTCKMHTKKMKSPWHDRWCHQL